MTAFKQTTGFQIWQSAHELRLKGDFDLAVELLKDLVSSDWTDPILKINSMNELVVCYRAFDKYEEAMELSIQVISLCIEKNYNPGKANAFINLGALSHLGGSFNQAKEFFRQSLKISEDSNDTLGICRSLIHIGLIARDEGMIEKAEGDLYTAFKLIEPFLPVTQDSFNIMLNALNHLAITKLIQTKFNESLDILSQALEKIKENFNSNFKSLILRIFVLTHNILDNSDHTSQLDNSITLATKKYQVISKDLILSKIFKLIFLWKDNHHDSSLQIITELSSVIPNQLGRYYYFINMIKSMIYMEQNHENIHEVVNNFENYYRRHSSLIRKSEKFTLMQIELMRVFKDQVLAINKGYSFGINRKYENVLRVARGHKESRIYLICYIYLLDNLIPEIKDETTNVKDENSEIVFNLLKQLKNDMVHNFYKPIIETIDILIQIFYTMEFTKNIEKLILIKKDYSKNNLTELELSTFKLEFDFTEKLSKLAEVSESNDLKQIKTLILSYQKEIREKIRSELRYFRFKVLEISYLLNTFALS